MFPNHTSEPLLSEQLRLQFEYKSWTNHHLKDTSFFSQDGMIHTGSVFFINFFSVVSPNFTKFSDFFSKTFVLRTYDSKR